MTADERAEAFGANLTGNPDTLHVFVVREGNLADALWPVVDSTLSQTHDLAGAAPFAQTKRSPQTTFLDRMGFALGVLTILMMALGAVALLWTGIVSQPEAEVVLVSRSWEISLTRSVPIATASSFPARVLVPVTISRSLVTATSGTGHTQARVAIGQVTFYNGAFESQTVAAGTVLRGRDGAVVVTEQAAIIPAALSTTPPTYGVTTVPAHSVEAGSAGNIAAYDLDTACCATSVLAENRSPFTGGQDARSFRVVQQADLDRAWQHLVPEVQQTIQTRLHAALYTGEQLAPLSCHQQRTASTGVGQIASTVKVILTMHCQAVAYRQAALQVFVTNLLTRLAVRQTGMPVQVAGKARVSVLSAAFMQSGSNNAALTFAASGLFIPAWTAHDLQRLAASLAGKTRAVATRWLLSQPGVQQAIIRISGSDSTRSTLPENPANIHLVIELPSVLPTPGSEPISSPLSGTHGQSRAFRSGLMPFPTMQHTTKRGVEGMHLSHKTHFWLLIYLLALVFSVALLIRAWSELSAVLLFIGLALALLAMLGLAYVITRLVLDLRQRALDARAREQQLLIGQEKHQMEMEQEAARLSMEYQERERQANLLYRQFELQQHLSLTRVQPTEHGYAAILDDRIAFTQIPSQGKPALLAAPSSERKNAVEGQGQIIEEGSPLTLPLPPTLDFAEVLRTWRPSPEEIFLFYTANGPVYEAMEQTCHIGLADSTGAGKTNCFRLILAQFLACGADLYLANPNFAPIKLNGRSIEDWRPIVGAMHHAVAWQIEDIQKLIVDANRRLDVRRERQQVSPLRGRDLYLALGEWPAIQSRWKDAAKPVAQLLREARQYGIHVVSEFQDALVSTLGMSSGVRESFRNAYYFGGDANIARVLLDLQGKGPLDETGLGKLGASLFRANSQPAMRGRVPFMSNKALYMLLGTPNNPLPDRLPEGADPRAFFGDHGIAVEDIDGELEGSNQQRQGRNVYPMSGGTRAVGERGDERRTGPLTPDIRRMRPQGERIHTLSRARTEAHREGQEGVPDGENQSDMSAHKTSMRRPVDRAHSTDATRTSPYPRMSPLQVELFVTAYRLTGNIDESLKQAGVNTRYRDHARLIIQQRNVKKEG